jgi:hypothetical protein
MRDDLHPQINAAPTHYAVLLWIRPLDHNVLQFSHLLVAQRRPADAQAATQSPSRQHHLRCSDAPSRTASAGPSHWLSPPRRAATSSSSAIPNRRRTTSASSIFTASERNSAADRSRRVISTALPIMRTPSNRVHSESEFRRFGNPPGESELMAAGITRSRFSGPAKSAKCLKTLADPTRFERATFAFGGWFWGFAGGC